jgi:DNA repair protein RadD
LDRNKQVHEIRPDRQQTFSQLLGIAERQGYKPGWASHKFKERFGDWPNGLQRSTMAPSPELLAWVKSRQIAWAKSRTPRVSR